MSNFVTLSRNENQALLLGEFAIEFLQGKFDLPEDEVFHRIELFHLDSIACGVSAIALKTAAPTIFRSEALEYPTTTSQQGACLFGSKEKVKPEKAILANCSAVREWDANGTNFGYNPQRGDCAGEFGHNDFYPVAIAAAQLAGYDGRQTLLAMILLDEIRGRLAEVFALHPHKIDHVLHGAIASAVVYGAVLGATAEQIESAIGMIVSHYIPYRAIRAGRQLSDSKGASAAISSEVAVLSMQRAMRGFVGPRDVFRNPQAIFCLYEPQGDNNHSPFDLNFATDGNDFAIMGMHFKIGLYEHQSAGAISALIDLLSQNRQLLESIDKIEQIQIKIYEPAFSIIGDPAKRNPITRQSADHSMVYIIATLLRKATQQQTAGWKELMLLPNDYNDEALQNETTRAIIQKIQFIHGGKEYDEKYPDGIPTSVDIKHSSLGHFQSDLVMYPAGHARNQTADLESLLKYKFESLASLGVSDVEALYQKFNNLSDQSPDEIRELYDFKIEYE